MHVPTGKCKNTGPSIQTFQCSNVPTSTSALCTNPNRTTLHATCCFLLEFHSIAAMQRDWWTSGDLLSAMDGYLAASFACLLVIMLNAEGSLVLCSVNPSIKGIQVLKQRKAEARVSRITSLLSEDKELSSANRKELNSLLRCDTYDPTVFSESHRLFKLNQNKVFSTLGMYCLWCYRQVHIIVTAIILVLNDHQRRTVLCNVSVIKDEFFFDKDFEHIFS